MLSRAQRPGCLAGCRCWGTAQPMMRLQAIGTCSCPLAVPYYRILRNIAAVPPGAYWQQRGAVCSAGR